MERRRPRSWASRVRATAVARSRVKGFWQVTWQPARRAWRMAASLAGPGGDGDVDEIDGHGL